MEGLCTNLFSPYVVI